MIKNFIKRIILYFWYLNLFLERFWYKLRGHKYYLLKGECHNCGKCCEEPAIRVGKLIFYIPWLQKFFIWWQLKMNGFRLKEIDYLTQTFIFECLNYDREKKVCLDYNNRPGICRDYPRALLYQVYPKFFPQCGYRPFDPRASEILAGFEKADLTEEQLSQIKKELYLE